MGIESVFACNTQNSKDLSAGGEKRFRMLRQPIMSEVSHAQRLPRQRLSTNGHIALLSSLDERWTGLLFKYLVEYFRLHKSCE
jgi:hypothetical protein